MLYHWMSVMTASDGKQESSLDCAQVKEKEAGTDTCIMSKVQDTNKGSGNIMPCNIDTQTWRKTTCMLQ